MPAKLTLQKWLTSTKKSWGLLVQFAVFIFGVVGSFLSPPPGWASSGEKTVVRFGQFIIAVLTGLILILVQRWNKKKHVRRWAIVAIVFLASSVVAFFVYQHLLDTRTCQYAGQMVVIGTRYTEHAQSYVGENPDSTCSSLLDDFAGRADEIWMPDSINKSRYILAGTYILTLPLLTICIMAVVQALYCSQVNTGQ